MATRMQQRRGTATQWTTANPILAAGEIGFESNTNKFKIGDGANHWDDLEYFANASSIEALIDGAPDALNTLNELAAAIGDAANYSELVENAVEGAVAEANGDTVNLIASHNAVTLNVHGITDTSVLATSSTVSTAIGEHRIETEDVHGIVDTSLLATTSDIDDLRTEVEGYADTEISAHNSDTVDVHGIADTSLLATSSDISTAVSNHNTETENVHGISDTSLLATQSYADQTATDITTDAINALDTDDIEEGATNQYYTSVRATEDAVAAMSVGTNEVVTDSLEVSTNDFNVGADAKDLRTDDDYTNPIAVFSIAASDYAQVAIKNTTDAADSSSDLILYTSNGDDISGWIDIGITAPSFADPSFTITGGNDGYIFMEAPVGTTGDGNLVIATGGNGTHNHIVFAAGGLQSNNTQMTIFPDENVHIEIDTPSVSPTTGALTVVGGVGIQGDLNINGDVNIEGTIVFGGEGTTVETSNLSVTDPLIFTGDGNASDIVDLGLIGEYTTGGNTKYAGIIRDASDGVIKAFKDATTKPTSTVDLTEAGLTYSDMQVAGLTASSLTVGDVSNTEFGYLNGVTSEIQTQIDTKSPINNPTFTGTVTLSASGVVFNDGTQTKEGVPSRTPIVQKTASYALSTLTHRDSLIEVSSGSATTITIPEDSTVNYPIGTTIDILQTNTGQVTIAPVSGSVTVNATPGLKLRTTWSSCTLMKRAANTWFVFGDLTA